jgi:hypothetical protein
MLPCHPLGHPPGERLKAWLLRWSFDLPLLTTPEPYLLLLHVAAAVCRHFFKLNQIVERNS